MRILYDNNGIEANCGGVSRYYAELLCRLPAYGCEYVLPYSGSTCQYFQKAPFNMPAREDHYGSFISRREFRGKHRLWRIVRSICPQRFRDYADEDRAAFLAAFNKGDFDVLHLTVPHRYGSDWKLVAGKKPIVVTIHDLVPEIMPDGFSSAYIAAIKRERAEVLAAASEIIAVSENTKRDLLRLYDVNDRKVSVIYHGAPNASYHLEHGNRVEKIILYVGKKDGYKNYDWFERAVRPLTKEGWQIVCSDGMMTDEQLAVAYRRATALVYPSKYEGFGLPILEAWANRCPVICARASCFPEIAAEAARYFEIGDAEGLCRQLRALWTDDAVRTQLIERGIARLACFSWDKCAKLTASVYRRSCEGGCA